MRSASSSAERLRLALAPQLGGLTAPATALALRALELAPAGGSQPALGRDPAERRRERLAEAVSQVRAAAGGDSVLRVLDVDPGSRVPERWTTLAPFNDPGGTGRRARARRTPTPRGRSRSTPRRAGRCVVAGRRGRIDPRAVAGRGPLVVGRADAAPLHRARPRRRPLLGRLLRPRDRALVRAAMSYVELHCPLRLLLPRRGLQPGRAGAPGRGARLRGDGADRPRRDLGLDGVRPGVPRGRG